MAVVEVMANLLKEEMAHTEAVVEEDIMEKEMKEPIAAVVEAEDIQIVSHMAAQLLQVVMVFA